MTVGWIFLVVTLSPSNQFLGGLIFGSPFFGPLLAMITICGVGPVSPARLWAWGFGWIGFELVLAWLLYRTTRASFDRCLGRVRESKPHRARRAS
jgi:hypothetical protein